MSLNIPAEFWDTLGLYVYRYGEYIGKGVRDRCTHHVNAKGYDLEDCVIVARNLERFEGKEPSILLESFLIETEQPGDNIVAGHYKECFVMSKLSDLVGGWANDQVDNFDPSIPFSWYTDNYETSFRGKISRRETNTVGMYVVSKNSKTGFWLQLYGDVNNEVLHLELRLGSQKKNYQECVDLVPGIEAAIGCKIMPESQGSSMTRWKIDVEDMDKAIEIWTDFFS